jgi:hypothetical protein
VPAQGSVSGDVGTSLWRLGAMVALLTAAVGAICLLVRWFTGSLEMDRSARRRRREQAELELASQQDQLDGGAPGQDRSAVPPGAVPQPRPARPPGRRRPAAHHPAGRRVPGAQAPLPVRPRRPIELVAADLRRLNHELSMVPGGMPMARRRGLLAAFDDVLIEAAELLQVPHQLPAAPPASRELERMRLLAALEAAGLVVTR